MKKVLVLLVLAAGFTSCIDDDSVSSVQPSVNMDFTFQTTQARAVSAYFKLANVDENTADADTVAEIRWNVFEAFQGNMTLDNCSDVQTAAFQALDDYFGDNFPDIDETTIRAELIAAGLGC